MVTNGTPTRRGFARPVVCSGVLSAARRLRATVEPTLRNLVQCSRASRANVSHWLGGVEVEEFPRTVNRCELGKAPVGYKMVSVNRGKRAQQACLARKSTSGCPTASEPAQLGSGTHPNNVAILATVMPNARRRAAPSYKPACAAQVQLQLPILS